MSSVLKDIFNLQKVLNNDDQVDNYGNIYFHSNERLKDIFSSIDVKDKNVLTVLASGDQTFYLYDNGAKKVDMYDVNKLAIHYYYLRTWIIKYMNVFYPKNFDVKFIKKIVNKVKPKSMDEKKSLRFWKLFILFFNNDDLDDLFCYSENPDLNRIDDLSRIRKGIRNNKINFFNIDMSGQIDIPNKYHIIFTSNIADYISHDEQSFKLYRDNIDSLLTDDGIVVCSNVLRGRASILEKEIFLEKFNLEELPYVENNNFTGAPGYVYKKKMLTKNS